MSVMLRFARAGTKKKPCYHLVAADKAACRDGRYLERLGLYNPKAEEGKKLEIDLEAAQAWIKKGAQVSETVGHLLKAAAKSK